MNCAKQETLVKAVRSGAIQGFRGKTRTRNPGAHGRTQPIVRRGKVMGWNLTTTVIAWENTSINTGCTNQFTVEVNKRQFQLELLQYFQPYYLPLYISPDCNITSDQCLCLEIWNTLISRTLFATLMNVLPTLFEHAMVNGINVNRFRKYSKLRNFHIVSGVTGGT